MFLLSPPTFGPGLQWGGVPSKKKKNPSPTLLKFWGPREKPIKKEAQFLPEVKYRTANLFLGNNPFCLEKVSFQPGGKKN